METPPTNTVVCPGCGLALPRNPLNAGPSSAPYNASPECFRRYEEVLAHTWQSGDAFFVHQYVVDAYATSHVSETMKPIQPFFALAGLYLASEKGYTGRQVQHAHMAMAQRPKNAPAHSWPVFTPPSSKPTLTIADVFAAPLGPKRDACIADWLRAVWETWADEHVRIRALTQQYLEATQ